MMEGGYPDKEKRQDPSDSRGSLDVVHHHPGRLRLRSDALIDDASQGNVAERAAISVPGVITASFRLRTGSLLVEYEPTLAEPERILARVADAARLTSGPGSAGSARRPVGAVAVKVARELNAAADQVTGHRADLRTIVPLGLAVVGAYAFVAGKGPRLPRWDNLLWWSYSVFVAHHREEIETGEPRAAMSESSSPRLATISEP